MTDNVIRLSPSRNFLIRQSVLNALNHHYPWGLKNFGAAHVLRRIETAGLMGYFVVAVCDQFELLTAIYAEAPPVSAELERAMNGAHLW